MKLSLIAASAVAALAVGSGTASAQVLVPHRGHYHVAPSYPATPSYGGLGYGTYSPGLGVGYGGYSLSPGFGFPTIQPSYYPGTVLVPHTTTHTDLIPHRGHFHAVPHTTTHYHVIRP